MPIESLHRQPGLFTVRYEGQITPGNHNQNQSGEAASIATHADTSPESAPTQAQPQSAFQSATRRLAQALSRTGARISAFFSPGHHTPRATELPMQRFNLRSLFHRLMTKLGVKSDEQPANKPPSVSTEAHGPDNHQTVSTTEALRLRCFKNGQISLKGMNEALGEIEDKSVALGATEENPLFTYLDVTLPTSEGDRFVKQIKPGHTAKLVLADYYEKKYGIKIHVQDKDLADAVEVGHLLLEKANAGNGEPVGLLLHRPRGKKTPTSPKGPDYVAHVTPFLIQKTPNGFDLIDLNIGPYSYVTAYKAAYLLQEAGHEIRILTVGEPSRQADAFSCHTDAMQVLKDALVEHQTRGGNLSEHYWTNYRVDQHLTARNPGTFTAAIELPESLYKVVQHSKALQSTRLSPHQVLAVKTPSTNPDKQQTVGAHRKRFSSIKNKEGGVMNNFLTFKAYKNAMLVLDQLNSFSNAQARNEYIEHLRVKNGFEHSEQPRPENQG